MGGVHWKKLKQFIGWHKGRSWSPEHIADALEIPHDAIRPLLAAAVSQGLAVKQQQDRWLMGTAVKRHGRRAPSTTDWIATRLGLKNPDSSKKGPNGKPWCRVCGKMVEGNQRVYCGTKCARFLWKYMQMTINELVFWRDGGVCSCCGLDTEALIEDLIKKGATPPYLSKELSERIRRGQEGTKQSDYWREWIERQTAVEFQLHQWGTRTGSFQPRSNLYDVDHIIPCEIYMGDSEELNSLDNLQTLCIVCHQAKTKAEAGMRAKRKRRAKKRGPKESQLRQMRDSGLDP